MKLTKKAINQIQVEERKKSREKQKNSEFMKRSLSIYKGQQARMQENAFQNMTVTTGAPPGVGLAPWEKFKTFTVEIKLPFTIEQFREWLQPCVNTVCACGKKLTIKALAVDHKTPIARGGGWDLSNLSCICKSCNFRKGQLTEQEFKAFTECVHKCLSPEGREDVWRRLTLGGKWSFGR